MAHVNTKTEQIVGAREGTLVWHHEKGHIEFAKSNIGSTVHYWQGVIFLALISSIVISLFENSFKWFSLCTLLIYFCIDIYEELWCWIYAYKKKRDDGCNFSR